MKLLETYTKLSDYPLMTKDNIGKIHPQMEDIFNDKEFLISDLLSKYIHISHLCSSSIVCTGDHSGIVMELDC